MMAGPAEHPTKRIFGPKSRADVTAAGTALMMIDLQYLDAHTDHGSLARARELGVAHEYAYYLERVHSLVIPHVQRLQLEWRKRSMPLVHVHIESLTRDGRDRGSLYRDLHIEAPRGSREADFLPEVAPRGDEIVIAKTSSSPFNSSTVDLILRNLGIRQIVLTGVMTSGCVESTARDAADRGYDVILVIDACAARTADMEDKTQQALGGTFAHLMDTAAVVQMVKAIPAR